MPKKILVREVDDQIHSQLGEFAEERGISLNSIVKDALDKWIKQQSKIPHRHDLIIYDDEKSLQSFLKTVDRFSKEEDWFKSFCGPPDHPAVKLLEKLGWTNATTSPYNPNPKEMDKYCGNVMKRVAKESDGMSVCCMDFILGDIGKTSLESAIKIEESYNKSRIPGLMFCPYQTRTLIEAGVKTMMDLFVEHDQVFVLRGDDLHKLHVTKESVHKLFMN
jgi:hypothetical protein